MNKATSRSVVSTVAAALFLLFSPVLAAEPGSGRISGIVRDASGAVLPDVTVSLAGGVAAEPVLRHTDAEGCYRFTDLPGGSYLLRFRREGYADEVRRDVRVSSQGPTAVNATLRPLRRETVAVTLDSGAAGMLTHQARVSTATPEGRPGDESAAETTTVTSRADLAVVISDQGDPAIAGGAVSYLVTVTNRGPSDARYVEVTGTPPAGATVASTTGCMEDPAGVPVCSLGTLPAGGKQEYSLTMNVLSGTTGHIALQASVSSQTMEVKPGDESASEDTAIDSRADLTITVADSIDPIIDGYPMSYTVTVSNQGPSDARGVVVTDILPSGLSFGSTTGCAEDPGGAPTCTLGTIPAGSSKQYTLAVMVAPGTEGAVTNLASVIAETTEASPGDESASEDTVVEIRADLVITTRDSVDPVIAGNSLTYTVRVANGGPSDARDVVVTDTLPPGVTVSSTTGCAEDPVGVPTCTLGAIPAGTSKQYLIVLTVGSDRTGKLLNQASVTSATAEASPGNEAVSEETRIDTRADLVITSRDSVDPVIAGNPLTYTVTVTNNGPSDALEVAVGGNLPEGVSFQATTGCAEDDGPSGGLPICTLGMISAGTLKQYTISVLVHPDATGVITHQAAVSSATIEASPGDEQVPRAAAPPRE